MTEPTYARISGLPLRIDGYELERLSLATPAFTRVTTVVRLRGDGCEGAGEDVTYSADEQDTFQRECRELPLAGSYTIDSFSSLLDTLDLFPDPPEQAAARDYRRWAFESAALDLALAQAETDLAARLERDPAPLHFVVSTGLRDASTATLDRILEAYPTTRFKLDPTPTWSAALCRQIEALGITDVLDFKGAYVGTPVDGAADVRLYRDVAETFADAWLEDPKLTAETDAVLAPHRDRITWDAPIHSVADITALPFAPRTLNLKPSRFGPIRALFDAYDYCQQRGIRMYGGGQFELGVGRGQIQALAALFHADCSNDVAPSGYNAAELPSGLPESPLQPRLRRVGFGWSG